MSAELQTRLAAPSVDGIVESGGVRVPARTTQYGLIEEADVRRFNMMSLLMRCAHVLLSMFLLQKNRQWQGLVPEG
jgi:hypothetical protein